MSKPSLILASGRFAGPAASLSRAAAFAHALAEQGCDVRWLLPQGPDAAGPSLPAGSTVGLLPVESATPRFSSVQDRLLDPASDQVLMRAIRSRMPDLVHVLNYGGATSVNLSWAAVRLGARCLISVDAAPTVCHRGDLRFRGAEECERFQDPDRCADCSLTAAPGGLSSPRAFLGRVLRALKMPLNPYPLPIHFENRQDLLVGGLQYAERVVVADEVERHRVGRLGVRDEVFEVLPPFGGEPDVVGRYCEWYSRLCSDAPRSSA